MPYRIGEGQPALAAVPATAPAGPVPAPVMAAVLAKAISGGRVAVAEKPSAPVEVSPDGQAAALAGGRAVPVVQDGVPAVPAENLPAGEKTATAGSTLTPPPPADTVRPAALPVGEGNPPVPREALPAAAATVPPPRGEATAPATPLPVWAGPAAAQPQAAWDQALGRQLAWMVQHHAQQAEIKVNPPHLGPVEVRLMLNQHDQASVSFYAHDATVREAIEQALPRLREMLGGQGVDLHQATVSDQSLARRSQEGGHNFRPDSGIAAGEAEADLADPPLLLRQRLGLVDHYV